MDASTEDLLTIVGGGFAIVLVTAIVLWMLIKSAAVRLAPVGLMLAAFCLEIYFIKQPFIQVGLQIYPNDVIFLFVLLATAAGFVSRPLPIHSMPFLLWLAFGITIMASLADGIQTHGRFAGTEARPFFYLWVAGLHCCTADFREADLRRIGRWCLWTAYVLIGIAAYYWVAVELGFLDRKGLMDADDETYVFRPVPAHAAFFCGLVGLVQTMAWLRGTGTRFSGLHAALLFTFVVIIQHRSAWIACAFGLAMVMMLERRHLPRRFALLLAFTLTLTFVLAVAGAAGVFDDLARRLMESVRSMDDNVGTFSARVDGWIRLLESWWQASAATQLFGFPFGHGYTRQYRGVIIEWSPHNFYLDLILRVGIVGAAFYVGATAMAIVHGLRAKCGSEFDYLLLRGLGVALLASMLYIIVYPSNHYLTGATGVLMAELIRRRLLPGHASTRPPAQGDFGQRSMTWRPHR